jgi:hypothetical protein
MKSTSASRPKIPIQEMMKYVSNKKAKTKQKQKRQNKKTKKLKKMKL